MSYIAKIESRVAGIPCLIGVHTFSHVKGSYSFDAPSDLDFHGYHEFEFDILDRRGRYAEWLERKITPHTQHLIEGQIIAYFQ